MGAGRQTMLLKVLFFAVLIYLVMKTTARLIQAMKGGEDPSHLNRKPPSGWDGPSQHRSYDEDDVEDAKFVDVS